jgi:putative N-acetylmannosamine-6-phosphate epimerase
VADIPYSVCSCLYTGIQKSIAFLTMQASAVQASKECVWKRYDDQLYHEVKEALQWHRQHCMADTSHLEEALRVFENTYNQVHDK